MRSVVPEPLGRRPSHACAGSTAERHAVHVGARPAVTPTIGFIILSHREPAQLRRLVDTLTRLYDSPPIVCHHDSHQSPIDRSAFPSNVRFVSPPLRTGWGKWSVVKAMLESLRLLYDHADPDWFVLMSGADYPIKPADRVRADLAAAEVDALIDYRQVGDTAESAAARFGPRNPALEHFESDGNRRLKWRHYQGAEWWFPQIRFGDAGRRARLGRFTMYLPFESPFSPFSRDFPCFYGDQWFTGSRRAAQLLLAPTRRHHKLRAHLRMRAVPDEGYYQTVLCNEPGMRLTRDNHRYARWNGGGAHPQLLTMDDWDGIRSTNAHFARKFAHGEPVLDRIDELLFG